MNIYMPYHHIAVTNDTPLWYYVFGSLTSAYWAQGGGAAMRGVKLPMLWAVMYALVQVDFESCSYCGLKGLMLKYIIIMIDLIKAATLTNDREIQKEAERSLMNYRNGQTQEFFLETVNIFTNK